MSAEVILMNKNGIAIAADSAVTIVNKTKMMLSKCFLNEKARIKGLEV